MDGAEASDLYSTVVASARPQRAGGREGCGASCGVSRSEAALDVSLGETVSSADLGGSSKYSYETYEDRSGERFHVNSNWTWVSRS